MHFFQNLYPVTLWGNAWKCIRSEKGRKMQPMQFRKQSYSDHIIHSLAPWRASKLSTAKHSSLSSAQNFDTISSCFLSTSWTFHLSLLTIIRQNHTKGWHASKAICERKFDGEQSLAFNCFPNCFLLSEIWGERRGMRDCIKIAFIHRIWISMEHLWRKHYSLILEQWCKEISQSFLISLVHAAWGVVKRKH